MRTATMLGRMIQYATELHSGQFDKAGLPYILHPLTVMHFVMKQYPDDEELLCIAIGHDLLEDTSAKLTDIVHMSSIRVADGIDALTKYSNQNYEEYKEKVFANRDAMIVKLSDLRHNSDIRRLRDITARDLERTNRYMSFYDELKRRLSK